MKDEAKKAPLGHGANCQCIVHRVRIPKEEETMPGEVRPHKAKVMRPRHVEVFKGVDGQFYVRTVASNGEVTAPSEGYKRKASAMKEAKARDLEVRDLTKVKKAKA